MGFPHRVLSAQISFKYSVLLRLITVPLLVVAAFSSPAFGVSPEVETDPAVTECRGKKCEPPTEFSLGNKTSQWRCGHEDCGDGTRCRIKVARAGEAGAVKTTNPEKPYIKCACVYENGADGPVVGETSESAPQ
ncbi:MAG: hypothetical protein RL417_933 [Pseudomonadota bacterium]|jgi:hypothetical protein